MEEVSLENEKTMHLDAHEILLSFTKDSGVTRFEEWWFLEGQKLFDKYCEEGDHFE